MKEERKHEEVPSIDEQSVANDMSGKMTYGRRKRGKSKDKLITE